MHTRTAILALRHFAHEHDDLPAFHAGYLVLTVVIAGLFNLGVFAALIAAHFSLDLVKYRELHGLSWKRTLEGALRESLLDFALLTMALTFAVFLHHTAGIITAAGVIRADLSLARVAGVFLPKVEILHRFLGVLLHMGAHLRTIPMRLGEKLTAGERLEVFLFVASLVLLMASPLILRTGTDGLVQILARELVPWRL